MALLQNPWPGRRVPPRPRQSPRSSFFKRTRAVPRTGSNGTWCPKGESSAVTQLARHTLVPSSMAETHAAASFSVSQAQSNFTSEIRHVPQLQSLYDGSLKHRLPEGCHQSGLGHAATASPRKAS